jgi:hypothetical protein
MRCAHSLQETPAAGAAAQLLLISIRRTPAAVNRCKHYTTRCSAWRSCQLLLLLRSGLLHNMLLHFASNTSIELLHRVSGRHAGAGIERDNCKLVPFAHHLHCVAIVDDFDVAAI